MIGLDKVEVAPSVAERSDPVVMMKGFGFIVPPEKVQAIHEKWDARDTLRMYMRMRAWLGYTREEINQKLGEAVEGKQLLVEVHDLDETHAAVEAVESRRHLLSNVVEDLSNIYAFSLELELVYNPDRKPELYHQPLQQQTTAMADLLREAMAKQTE
uniref:Uncharacterized protein n=1 Tax=Pseudomonas phage RVTF4 TaxID=3236931 RepID=A0AB39CCN1_9VIRU